MGIDGSPNLHGAEMAVNPEQLGRNPSVPQQEQTMKSLSEKNVALNPGNLKDLQEMMKKNAFELTRGLPILLKSYLQSIGALVEAAKQIKEED